MTDEDRQNQAWKLRETGKPIESLGLLIPLIIKYEAEGNWKKVIDFYFDASISWKIHGRQTNNPIFYSTSQEILNNAKRLAKVHQISLRTDWDNYVGEVQMAKGDFNDAIESYTSYLNKAQLNPEEKANINCQLGFAYAQTGQKEKGIEILRDSIDTLSNPTNQFTHEGIDVAAIWLTGAKLKLAQIVDRAESQKLLRDALQIARDKGLGAREKQIKELLKNN